jgi:hypothetical protein
MGDQQAVEVVAVGSGEPWPGANIRRDRFHLWSPYNFAENFADDSAEDLADDLAAVESPRL